MSRRAIVIRTRTRITKSNGCYVLYEITGNEHSMLGINKESTDYGDMLIGAIQHSY